MADFTDDFNRADGGLGGNWSAQVSNAAVISGNRVRAHALATTDEVVLTTFTPGNDQYARITLSTFQGSGSGSPGPHVRCASPGTRTFYEMECLKNEPGGARTQIIARINGVANVLASESATSWTSGDVAELSAVGTLLTAKRNGFTVLTVNDSSLTGGLTGFRVREDGSLGDTEIDDFQSGDATGGGGGGTGTLQIGSAVQIYNDSNIPITVDGSLATVRRDASTLYFYHSFGETQTSKWIGTTNDPFQTIVPGWPRNPFSNGPSITGNLWLYNIYKIDATHAIGFVHHECCQPPFESSCNGGAPGGGNGFPYAFGIAYTSNLNSPSESWLYLGDVARPQDPTVNIGGMAYLIVGSYFYVYFQEAASSPPQDIRGVTVVRALVSDVLSQAAIGQNTTWTKYSGGGVWNTNALTGLGAVVLPATQWSSEITLNTHADAAHCSATGKYMVMAEDFTGKYLILFQSSDGVNFPSSDAVLVDTNNDPALFDLYSTFASTNSGASDDNSEVGSAFTIFFNRKRLLVSYFDDQYFRVPVTVSGAGDFTPPTAPSSLVATAVSSSQISLTWNASTDNVAVTGYLVERCQGGGCSNFSQIVGPTNSTSLSDFGLSASTSYSYRVRATDAAGNLSGYSNTSSATTLQAPTDTTPPTITITIPTSNPTFSTSVSPL